MEDNIVRIDEYQEETESAMENEEISESSRSGGVVAGIVGGFLAYAVISGAKRLWTVIEAKMAERKKQKNTSEVVDADYTQVEDDAKDSDE